MRRLLPILLLTLTYTFCSECTLIAVVVPGHQGQAVVNAIQQSRDLSCRIVAPSQGTKDYSNLGCEVVKADLDSVESIRKALDGAEGVFATLLGSSEAGDLQISKNIVDAAALSNSFLIWSSQQSMKKLAAEKKDTKITWINDTWVVPWMDAKSEVAEYITQNYSEASIFIPADSYESIWESGYLHFPNIDKPYSYQLSLPIRETIAYPLVSIDDAAMAIINMFKNKKDYVGKTIFFAGDKLTTREIVSRFASTHMGLPVKHASLEIEEFVKGFTNAEGLANMFWLYNNYPSETLDNFDPDKSRKIFSGLKNFETFLSIAENKQKVLGYFQRLLKTYKIYKLEQEQLQKEATGNAEL